MAHPSSTRISVPPQELAGLSMGPVQTGAPADDAVRELLGAWLKPARGRWLRLVLTPAVAASQVRLVVRGTTGRWPDTAVHMRVDDEALCGWVFITEGTQALQLHGSPQSLATLQQVCAELHDAPADESLVPVTMLTAAALYRMGVRGLREVEFREDRRWPLMATGHDPQLRFVQADSPAGLQVELEIATDREASTPVLYWTDKGGSFESHASRPLHAGTEAAETSAPRSYIGGLPPLRSGSRWRLDPCDTPGYFRIDALRVRAEQRAWPPLVRRTFDWLSAWHPTRGIADLVPAKDMQPIPGLRDAYVATTDDPQMRLSTPLAAGWYMLELALDLPVARGRAKVYLDAGQGELEAEAMSLPLRSAEVRKRLIWVRSRARLRLDPTAAPGEFTIGHFKLQRVSRSFAMARMRAKLEGACRGCRAPAGTATTPAQRPQESLAAFWQAYCNIFEPRHEGAISYADWIAEVEQPAIPAAAEQARQMAGWRHKPVISVITPTYNTPPTLLRACLDSVLAQIYPHWELCIADDASTRPEVRRVIEEYIAKDSRVRVCWRERNGHISLASNSAIELATGEFIALLDHDDELAPHALFAVVRALQHRPGAQIVYSDEDKLDADGQRSDPFFKPDWSPDLLRSQNYVSHLGVYRRELVESVGHFRQGYEGSQDYDLLLRCLSRVVDAADVLHVPEVLYHWRKTEGSTAAAHEQKPYATEAARRALQEHADAWSPGVKVSVIAPGLYRHRWPIPDPAPVVSLIIPTRDGLDVLRTCIDSIIQRTTYPHYEILVVDNQSSDPETLEYLEALPHKHGGRVRVLSYDQPFNYSAINNYAVQHAQGSVIGLINNDVEVISPEWLTEMTSHAVRPDIGCVGAKLYYPDDTLQHAGVVLGIGGVAGHSHKYFDRSDDGYFSRLRIVHNVSAVTGAVLLVRKDLFSAVGGLDAEHLHVAFNDVDLCLKVREAGFLNLWTPFAELYHHESKTRGADTTSAKQQRFDEECEVMRKRWRTAQKVDPFYSPNLTRVHEDFSLNGPFETHQACIPAEIYGQ
jgi:glycosyltransferase involved in cell wall biosynthesis